MIQNIVQFRYFHRELAMGTVSWAPAGELPGGEAPQPTREHSRLATHQHPPLATSGSGMGTKGLCVSLGFCVHTSTEICSRHNKRK